MATGLVNPPDRTALIASRNVLKELEKEIVSLFELDDPKPLYACPIKPTYIDQVSKEPPYEEWVEYLDDRIGLEEAGAYQILHQQARQYVLDRYPGNQLTGIVGAVSAPPDEIGLTRWRFMVDTIENQRIGRDLCSASLLPKNVDAFKECFPEVYDVVLSIVDREMDKRLTKANGNWRPNWWQDAIVRRLKKAPAKPAPPAPKPPVAEKKSDIELPLEKLEPVVIY